LILWPFSFSGDCYTWPLFIVCLSYISVCSMYEQDELLCEEVK
jgi:hypothetical protein